jgi:hypothetical protein
MGCISNKVVILPAKAKSDFFLLNRTEFDARRVLNQQYKG